MTVWKKNLIFLIGGFALVGALARLFFGIDFSDESQYIAQAMGPINGGHAFITDRLFQQSGSLLATPFLWIYVKVIGSTTGLVIFFRLLNFFVAAMTSVLLFKSFRLKLKREHAFGLALLPMLYMPFSLPGVSYNSMAILLTLQSFALWRLVQHQVSLARWVGLSITVTLAMFSYSPLAIPFSMFFIFEFRQKKHRPVLVRVLGLTSVLWFALAGYLFSLGIPELEKNLDIARKVSLFTIWDKIRISGDYLKLLQPSWWCVAAIIALATIQFWRKRTILLVALPCLCVFYMTVFLNFFFETAIGFFVIGTFFIVLFGVIERLAGREKWTLTSEVATGFAFGAVASYASSNAILNAGLGFFVALIFIFEQVLIRKKLFPLVAWVTVVIVCGFAQWSFFYREARLPQLIARVDSGPFLGIYTNTYKQSLLKLLEEDFKTLPAEKKSIFVGDSFPAGYFLSFRLPITFLYYMHPITITPTLRPELVDFFAVKGARPEIVVEMNYVPITENTHFITKPEKNDYADPFWDFFKNSSEYERIIQRPNYSIYQKK